MYIVCSLLGRLNLGSCASCQGKLERVCIIGLVLHPQELANEATFNNGFGIWCNLSNTQYFVLHEVYVSNPWLCTHSYSVFVTVWHQVLDLALWGLRSCYSRYVEYNFGEIQETLTWSKFLKLNDCLLVLGDLINCFYLVLKTLYKSFHVQ